MYIRERARNFSYGQVFILDENTPRDVFFLLVLILLDPKEDWEPADDARFPFFYSPHLSPPSLSSCNPRTECSEQCALHFKFFPFLFNENVHFKIRIS